MTAVMLNNEAELFLLDIKIRTITDSQGDWIG